MESISITKQNAVQAYRNADETGKKLLSDLIGKDILPGNIMQMVKSFEDAQALDTGWTEKDQEYLDNVKKATIITRVLNEGWKPDYSNKKEEKWYVWMQYDQSVSAFRFGITLYVCTDAISATGSRHVFKSAELAKYFANNFTDLINKIIL